MIAGLLTNSGNVRSDRSRSSNQLQMDITGTVTGVDISAHRLSTCRALLKRHRLQQCARLFQADGTTFSVMRPSALDAIRARIMAGIVKSKSEQQVQNTSQGKRSLDDSDDDSDPDSGAHYGNGGASSSSQARQQFHTNYTLDADNSMKRQMLSGLTPQQREDQDRGHVFNGTEILPSQEKVVPFYAPKILRNDPQTQSESYKYDKVIVDAECK